MIGIAFHNNHPGIQCLYYFVRSLTQIVIGILPNHTFDYHCRQFSLVLIDCFLGGVHIVVGDKYGIIEHAIGYALGRSLGGNHGIVGTGIAASVPIVGQPIKEIVLGGTIINQNTLIRFYVLHVIFLPAICFCLAIWHMWRVRKDGGLAIVEQVRDEAKAQEPQKPKGSKTYSILGVVRGVTAQVSDPTAISENNSRPSSPHLTMRILNVVLITTLVTILLSIFVEAPLEGPANPEVTPNPAKAPWYFIGMQELVAYSAFLGGIVTPLIALLGLASIPFIDRKQEHLGVWFTNKEGKKWSVIGLIWGCAWTSFWVFVGVQFPLREIFSGIDSTIFFEIVNPVNLLFLSFLLLYLLSYKLTRSVHTSVMAIFSAFIIAYILLTLTGAVLRGPNWMFFWPWQSMPANPIPY